MKLIAKYFFLADSFGGVILELSCIQVNVVYGNTV